MCNTDVCSWSNHLTNSFHLKIGLQSSYGHRAQKHQPKSTIEPPRSQRARIPEARALEARTGLNLCSLCVWLEDSQKKSPQNSAQGKCLLKLLVSPLFCKAGGSEIKSLVKVKETSKRNFPNKTYSHFQLSAEFIQKDFGCGVCLKA